MPSASISQWLTASNLTHDIFQHSSENMSSHIIYINQRLHPTRQLEPSPYSLVGQSSLHLNLIASGKKANNPDVMKTQCKLHLFINPNGQEVAVSARLRKSKNYNDGQDLRYLGHSYKVKFTKAGDAIIKRSKPIYCNKRTSGGLRICSQAMA